MLDFAARMIAPHLTGNSPAPECESDALPSLGMAAGTKVATSIGWRPVEAVAAGDRVLTFDAGLKEVIAIERFSVAPDLPASLRPLRVPEQALGNHAPMVLLSEQPVVLEADCAEELFGDPFVLVPAGALDGFRGIHRIDPGEMGDVIALRFAEDQVVFANLGALFFCSSYKTNGLDKLLNTTPGDGYAPLPLDVAESLIDLVALEERAALAT